MEDNIIFAEKPKSFPQSDKPQSHTASLVLGILSIVLGLLFAIVGEILGIIGIVLACKNRPAYNTRAGLVCSIIGLVLSVVNHVVGILLLLM